MKKIMLTFLVASVSSVANASLISGVDLNFGNLNLESEIKSTGTLSFTDPIGSDGETSIYGQVVALTDYQDGGKVKSGSVNGDVRINQKSNTTTTYSFTLYQDAGLSEIYSPSADFSFDLFFYDIDGHDTQGDKYYDILTVYTPSVAEFTSTTALTVTQNADGSITASGEGTDGVKGQDGLQTFNQAQADVAISFNFTQTSNVVFDYTIVNTFNKGNRNLVFDANDLNFSGFTTETLKVAEIAEPSSLYLALLAILGIGINRITSKTRTAKLQ